MGVHGRKKFMSLPSYTGLVTLLPSFNLNVLFNLTGELALGPTMPKPDGS